MLRAVLRLLTAVDFAACMRELADIHFPKTERINSRDTLSCNFFCARLHSVAC